ncbi:MAG: MGMT family protein, partial [Kiloniellales bacterium]
MPHVQNRHLHHAPERRFCWLRSAISSTSKPCFSSQRSEGPGQATSLKSTRPLRSKRTPSARIVGYAMAHLPSGSKVPWQRVINSQGQVSPRKEGSS